MEKVIAYQEENKRQDDTCANESIDFNMVTLKRLKDWIKIASLQPKPPSTKEIYHVYIFKGYNKDYYKEMRKIAVAYKIGYSSNLKNRIVNLRKKFCGRFIHTIATDNGAALESLFHSIFAEKDYKDGWFTWEWFGLEQDDIDWLKTIKRINMQTLVEVIGKDVGHNKAQQILTYARTASMAMSMKSKDEPPTVNEPYPFAEE